MSLITDFNSPVLIEFISHVAKEETMKKCFTTLINKKLAVAKYMLNSKVDIVYKVIRRKRCYKNDT